MIYKKNAVINIITAFVLVVATLVITGWFTGITALISITANMTAMNPLTAVCFILICVWLFVQNNPDHLKPVKWLQIPIAAFIFVAGFLKLMDYASRTNIHVDQYLFAGKLNGRYLHNAIAPTTALLFLLTGILLFNANIKNRVNALAHDVIIVIAFLLSYLGAVGYIYSLEPFYRIGPFVPMALNTAACFMMSILALFLVQEKGNIFQVLSSRESGGKLARRAIPFMLLIPPAFGYVRLLLLRAHAYNTEYGVALDTAFLVVLVLTLIYYYAKTLNRKDAEGKKIQAEVIANEAKYKSLIYSLKEGVIYFNEDGSILFYNDSFCKLTGYEQGELVGRNVVDVLSSADEKANTYKQLEDRKKGISADYERQIMHKDGRKISVDISARQIVVDGKPIGFFSTFTDITARKKHEEDIEAFSASAAHDLNAPLARIEMLTSFMLDYNKERFDAEDIEMLEGIAKTSGDLRKMLKDLLQFSKIGSEAIKKSPIDMKEMAETVVKSSMYINPKAEIHLGNIPVAYGDASAVKHIWDNLILNALKYSSKKDHPKIDIGAEQIDGRQVYYVKDNGAGFDMAGAAKLFSPFKRFHTDFEGNGLGLPIAKRIVEKHGGKIWAQAEKNKGAVFYFSL